MAEKSSEVRRNSHGNRTQTDDDEEEQSGGKVIKIGEAPGKKKVGTLSRVPKSAATSPVYSQERLINIPAQRRVSHSHSSQRVSG